jgi:hypothetical protein
MLAFNDDLMDSLFPSISTAGAFGAFVGQVQPPARPKASYCVLSDRHRALSYSHASIGQVNRNQTRLKITSTGTA